MKAAAEAVGIEADIQTWRDSVLTYDAMCEIDQSGDP